MKDWRSIWLGCLFMAVGLEVLFQDNVRAVRVCAMLSGWFACKFAQAVIENRKKIPPTENQKGGGR